MNIKRKNVLISVILGIVGGLAISSLQSWLLASTKGPSPEAVSTVVVQHSSSELLTRETMITQADAIFVGKVVSISPTSWNQDNGSYWDDGFLLHTVDVEILRPVAGNKEFMRNGNISITILGNSPLDGIAEHSLKVGDQAAFFVNKTEIAWREGNKTVFILLGVPTDSYFLLGKDGLYHGRYNEPPISIEQLISQISDRREVITQP